MSINQKEKKKQKFEDTNGRKIIYKIHYKSYEIGCKFFKSVTLSVDTMGQKQRGTFPSGKLSKLGPLFYVFSNKKVL